MKVTKGIEHNRVAGGLFPRPPHHPACGSAPGGSLKLPGRSRVMSLHPQFFDRYETLIFQPLVGHTVLGGQPAGHGPRTASVQSCPDGCSKLDTQFQQVPNLGAAPPPLFPIAKPHPAPDPAVYFRDVAVAFGNAEVPHPAAEVGRQPVQPVLHGDEPASSGVLLDAAAELLVRLVGPEDFGSLEDEAKKADLVASGDLTLVFVDRELELGGQILPDAPHDPFSGTLTLHEDDEVVGVTDELVATFLKLLVQMIEEDVGEQWRKRTALGNTQAGLFQPPVHLHPGPEVLTDQASTRLSRTFLPTTVMSRS